MFTSWRHLVQKKHLSLLKRANAHRFNYSSLSKKNIHQCHSHKFKWQNPQTWILFAAVITSSHIFNIGKACLKKKNRSRLTQASSAYVHRRRRMWVGEELKHSHSGGGTTQSNNFQTILFNVLPLFDVFLSRVLSLPACLPSITSSHALLPPAAGPHIAATFICGSLPHAFIFSFPSFFILSQRRAHIHLAAKRFTSDLSQLISILFHPSATLTTSQPFGGLSSKTRH